MDKNKIVAEIASRHGVLIGKDDPAFYIVDLATMVIEEKAEEIREAIGKGEQSIPYLLDLKRKEIDEAAARILAALDALEEKRRELAETLQQDVDNELRARVEDYTSQVMAAMQLKIQEVMHSTAQNEMTHFAKVAHQAAAEFNQARIGKKKDLLQEIVWISGVSIVASITTLLSYITLFQ